MISNLADLTDAQKSDMIASLSVFLAASGTAEEDEELVTPAKLQAIAKASGNSLSEGLATLFASVAGSAPGGALKAYMLEPGGGGGGGGYVFFLFCFVLFCQIGSCTFLAHFFLSRFYFIQRRRRWRRRSCSSRRRKGWRGRGSSCGHWPVWRRWWWWWRLLNMIIILF